MEEQKENTSEANHPGFTPAVDLPIPSKKASPFSAETRLGRFLRDLARALVIILVLVGLGALLVYIFQVRPIQQEQAILVASATQTADDLLQRNMDLKKAQQELSNTSQRLQSIQSNLQDQEAGKDVLRAINELSRARIAVLEKKPEAAIDSLSTAEKYMKITLEAMDKSDKTQADSIRALFTLAKNDSDRDPVLFAQDIDRLEMELKRIEQQSP